MNKKNLDFFLIGIFFIISCYICFSIGQSHPKFLNITNTVRDTLTIRDTITIEKPIEIVRWKEKEKLIYVSTTDTLIVHQNDTTYIALQEEKVEYKEEEYRAVVSGVHPKLEEISIYPKTVYITETQEKILVKHWNFNITAGPGLIYDFKNKQISGGIGVVFGFGYNF